MILDKSKIRPDILKILDNSQKLRTDAITKFFSIKENQKFDFTILWNKVMDGNTKWLNGEDVKGYLTKEEMHFLARQHRYNVDFISNQTQKMNPISKDVKIEQINANGVPAEWQVVPGAIKDQVLLYFHGGGHIMGSPNNQRLLTVRLGYETKLHLLSVDYCLAPEYPYPAPVEDCVNAYIWLLNSGIKPKNIIISGDSAGGYYTLITLVWLKNKGIPLPAGGICFSPSTDMAQTGESRNKNSSTDVVLADLGYYWWIEAYLAGANPFDPKVSPLYADLKDLPPILLQVSSSEMLFDDSRRFYERAKETGIDITFQSFDDTVHVFQSWNLPESKDAINKVAQFVTKLL
jgi:acetyl esterase/lipase